MQNLKRWQARAPKIREPDRDSAADDDGDLGIEPVWSDEKPVVDPTGTGAADSLAAQLDEQSE